MNAVTRRALIFVEAILVGALLADAVFNLTDSSIGLDLLLAVAFAAALVWDVRR